MEAVKTIEPGQNLAEGTLPAAVAVAAGLVAAWAGAGSLGLTTPLLDHALVWIALAAALLVLWPTGVQAASQWYPLIGTAVVLAAATGWASPPLVVLAVGLVLLAIAQMQSAHARSAVQLAAMVVLSFGLYRLAYLTIPVVWLSADGLATALSGLAGKLLGCPLSLGPSFLGLDYLFLSGLFYAGWLWGAPSPRRGRAVYAAAALLAGHLLYLYVLGHAQALLALLPTAPPVPQTELEQTPAWFWGDALRGLLPWGLPSLAVVIHASIAAVMVAWGPPARSLDRCCRRLLEPVPEPVGSSPSVGRPGWPWWFWDSLLHRLLLRFGSQPVLAWIPLGLAIAVPLLLVLEPIRTDLQGKQIVAYENSFLDWAKPRFDAYGQDAAGTLGMLPVLVQSLGGRFTFSRDLSQGDLNQADVLLLIHPNAPWTAEQKQRLRDYVRRGGALLVAAENRVFDEGRSSTFDEILEQCGLRVHDDSAISPVSGWRGSLQTTYAACGADLMDRRESLGLLAGASLRIDWASRPLLVGRWGWSDPGSDAVLTGPGRWEPGERLGDVVLAAQRRVGAGTVLVLGSTSSLSNVMLPGSFQFVGRLLSSLAHRSITPGEPWRQALGLAALLIFWGLLLLRPDPLRVAIAMLLLGLTLTVTLYFNSGQAAVLPDGRQQKPNRLAYIDATHLELYTGLDWSERGIAGLALTLMRNGYLPLLAPDCSGPRLERAGLLISIAPARQFSSSQRRAVRQFAEQGGSVLITVGAEDAANSRDLLAEYGIAIPRSPAGLDPAEVEPEPMGCMFSRYLSAPKVEAQALFYAAWPLDCDARTWTVLVRDSNGDAIVATRSVGKGMLAVIGDSRFPLNKYLEQANGEPVHGGRHNAYFWRWFLTVLSRQPEWLPPADAAKTADSATQESKPAKEAGR